MEGNSSSLVADTCLLATICGIFAQTCVCTDSMWIGTSVWCTLEMPVVLFAVSSVWNYNLMVHLTHIHVQLPVPKKKKLWQCFPVFDTAS